MQLTLFDAAESPMEKELRTLDVNVLSPIEALNLLVKWKGEK
jgi:hypothetical protein